MAKKTKVSVVEPNGEQVTDSVEESITDQKNTPGLAGSITEQVQEPTLTGTLEEKVDENKVEDGELEETDKRMPEEELPTAGEPSEEVTETEDKKPEEVKEDVVTNPPTKLYKHKYQGRKEPLLLSGSILECIYFLFSEGAHIVSFTEGLTKDNLEFLKAAEVKTSKEKSIKLEYNDEKGYIFEEVE